VANIVELLTSLRVVERVFPGAHRPAQLAGMPHEHKQVFALLYAASQRMKFHIKTKERQHCRPYVLQQIAKGRIRPGQDLSAREAPSGINHGKGLFFVSHTGEVYPGGFLPPSASNAEADRQNLSKLFF
jgi:hypothetical protein